MSLSSPIASQPSRVLAKLLVGGLGGTAAERQFRRPGMDM